MIGRSRRRRPLPRDLHDTASIIEHLEELRRRVFWCLGWFTVAFLVAYGFREQLVGFLGAPLPRSAAQPMTLSVAEPLMTTLRVCAYAALVATVPVAAYHLWSFVAPALERARRRSIVVCTVASALLFAGGLAFGYLVALPQALTFLTRYGDGMYDVQLRASELYRFAALSILASALVFQLPVVVIGLVRFRVLTVQRLRSNRRVGWACVAVLAVLMPGVDPILTAITFVPLLVLYEATILVARLLDPRWSRERAAAVAPRASGDGGGTRMAA